MDFAAAFSGGKISWPEYEAALAKLERKAPARDGTPRYEGPRKLLREPPKGVAPWSYSRVATRTDRDGRHSGASRRLLGQLATWARGRGSCDAFVDQLADAIGVTPRTVQRAQARLETLGYIRIIRHRVGRINDANTYYLTELAVPTQSCPRRTHGGDRNVTPRTVPTEPEVSNLSRSNTRSKRGALDARTPPRRFAAAPPRTMREGAVLARSDRASAVPADDDRCSGTLDLEDWLREHPPP